jgi:hypothetical protein
LKLLPGTELRGRVRGVMAPLALKLFLKIFI